MSLATEIEFGRNARDLPRRAFPLVDVGPVITSHPDTLRTLAEQSRKTGEGVGFTALANHGLSQNLTRRMLADRQGREQPAKAPDAELLGVF